MPCSLGNFFGSLSFFLSIMGFIFIFLYDFVGHFLATVHPDIGIKLPAHQSGIGRRVLRVVCGEGSFGLGHSFNMVTTSLLHNRCNPSSAGKGTNIPTITKNFFKGFGRFTYPINGPLGSPRMNFSSEEYAPTLAKLVFSFHTQSKDFSKHLSLDS
jgi:hypothetical protein